MNDPLTCIIAGLLLSGITLTAWAQVRHAAFQKIRRFDRFSLLPGWWFFAPHPAIGDYCLLSRDLLSDNSSTDWSELIVGGSRPWHSFVFHPERRLRKAFFDIVSTLLKKQKKLSSSQIQAEVPYLLILTYVSSLPHFSNAKATQFAIMLTDESNTAVEPTILFLSSWHGLPD